MRIILYRGTGIINALIRWQTRSHYAHAAIMDEAGGKIYESFPGVGVCERSFEPEDFKKDAHHFVVTEPFLPWEVREFISAQLGKKYDYAGVFRFLTRSKERKHDQWFCSELVFEAFRAQGVKLLNCDEGWKVSPALLAMSPYLERVK